MRRQYMYFEVYLKGHSHDIIYGQIKSCSSDNRQESGKVVSRERDDKCCVSLLELFWKPLPREFFLTLSPPLSLFWYQIKQHRRENPPHFNICQGFPTTCLDPIVSLEDFVAAFWKTRDMGALWQVKFVHSSASSHATWRRRWGTLGRL